MRNIGVRFGVGWSSLGRIVGVGWTGNFEYVLRCNHWFVLLIGLCFCIFIGISRFDFCHLDLSIGEQAITVFFS